MAAIVSLSKSVSATELPLGLANQLTAEINRLYKESGGTTPFATVASEEDGTFLVIMGINDMSSSTMHETVKKAVQSVIDNIGEGLAELVRLRDGGEVDIPPSGPESAITLETVDSRIEMGLAEISAIKQCRNEDAWKESLDVGA
jgi:hypothetical protein